MAGSAAAHGKDHRVPAWFEGEIWEMAELPPVGDLEDESTAPLWVIAPGADETGCAQIEDFDLSVVERSEEFAEDEWDSVDFDHTLSINPFSALWHVHFVFGETEGRYTPDDLVNVDEEGNPLTDGETIRAASVTEVSIPFGFNCPIRPADEEHRNYCD